MSRVILNIMYGGRVASAVFAEGIVPRGAQGRTRAAVVPRVRQRLAAGLPLPRTSASEQYGCRKGKGGQERDGCAVRPLHAVANTAAVLTIAGRVWAHAGVPPPFTGPLSSRGRPTPRGRRQVPQRPDRSHGRPRSFVSQHMDWSQAEAETRAEPPHEARRPVAAPDWSHPRPPRSLPCAGRMAAVQGAARLASGTTAAPLAVPARARRLDGAVLGVCAVPAIVFAMVARLPSARQAGEQYNLVAPDFLASARLLEHTRHFGGALVPRPPPPAPCRDLDAL